MGEDIVLQIGAADVAWSDLRLHAIMALAGAGVLLAPWVRRRIRGWRIRRAEARGDHEHAGSLAFDNELDEPPRKIRQAAGTVAFVLIGVPVLMVFQVNFADELAHMLGEGWGFLALLLTFGLLAACSWAWRKVRRNALSPRELEELEEEEEHQRWIRSIEGTGMAALGFGIGGAIVVMFTIVYLLVAGSPG